MKTIALFLLKVYKRLLSPLLPNSCRFYPTCSEYSRQAIEKFGVLKGTRLSIVRISKCHPFHKGGIDEVP
ncbi:MAG: membrane protein insertion efficiency factor YidD [Candidatus Kapabacteria bacterium]|nr:membrane protein insertion efficiency factor YidD [Candidatus Kapabacteria bacterium]